MGPTVVQGVNRGLNDVRGSVEIGLTDFKMNNVPALGLQGPRLG